jgi:Na+/H+-dicarboxylate symporter
MPNDQNNRLTLYILGAIAAAVTLAFVRPDLAIGFEAGGEIFLRLLTMMVVPLVISSVMSGIIGLGDIRKLGRPGGVAIAYYLTTTVMAVAVGLVMVNLIEPGVGAVNEATLEALAAEGEGLAAQQAVPTFDAILRNLVLMLFTDNLFASAAETNLLPLIVFSVIFAAMLTTMGQRVAAISQMIVQVNDAFLSFILLLMRVAPVGIFCLVTARFGEAQAEGNLLEVLRQTGAYFSTVLAGLAIHSLLTLPAILWIFTRRNPLRFMYQMSQALLTAFSTASSTATLPVTMECAVSKAGVSKRSSEFVLPLGATINMDGTALYEAGAVLFIAQAVGLELGLTQQLVVAVTATLAAIGAAGIPEAGLVTMIIVLNAVGTTVNAFGDAVGAAVVEKSFV